jgi:hypothetical protein
MWTMRKLLISRRILAEGLLLVAVVAGATPAFAQAPVRGVFGAQGAAPPPETLDLNATFSGVYDSRLPQFRGRAQTHGGEPSLYYNDLHAGLWYTKRGPHTLFSANGVTAIQQFPQIANTVRQSVAGAVAYVSTTQRSSFRVEQRVRYSPFHGFRVVPVPATSSTPADVSAPDLALAVSGQPSYESSSVMGWAYQTTNRSSLSAEYMHDYLGFPDANDLNWRTQDARVEWRHDTTHHAAVVVGYDYHRRDLQSINVPVVRHDIDVGLAYGNRLPFSERTHFDGSIGTTLISGTQRAVANPQKESRVRLIGQANLDHQVTRTWHAGLSYNQGWQYIEGLPNVFFAYSVIGTVGGYVGRRVEVQGTTGYSTGGLRFTGHQRAWDSNASTARVRVGISRNFAVQAEYLYYRFLFSDAVTLPTGTVPRDNRHVLRVGLTTWFPFF